MSDFDIDLVMGPRRAARAAWIVAGCSCAVSVLLALTITVMLPLRETEVFTVLVDSTSGAAERIYQVQPTGITDEEAIMSPCLSAISATAKAISGTAFRSGSKVSSGAPVGQPAPR